MKNVKMKTKLILGFFVPILLTVINSAIGVWSTRHTVSTVEGMYEAEYQTVVEKLAEIGADEEKGDILLDAIASEITNSVTSLKTVATQLNAISIALIVISVIITLIIALSIIKSIMVSIRELSGAAKDIAMGRVDIDLIKHGNDEFGELVDDYKEVISNIKTQAQIAEEVSHGNLTVTVTPKSPEDLLGNSLKKLVEDNLTTLSNISDAGTQVTISSSQVASASQALAQGSTEQASAIEEITASIDEIADKTKQNAEQANEAAGLVLHAIEDVKKGNQQMEDMVNAMQDINQSSESISKIIKTIDDIAFQTNILALNAAVEAARAGEAGKGFAVVAEEVRSLAAKSASAAKETAEMIEDSISKVSLGSQIADDTAQALEAITKIVQESEVIINGIAESSNYQATAVAQIEQAITQVSQVVQTNSATSEECAAASEELSNQASKMRDMLSIYNLRGGHSDNSFKSVSSSDEVSNEQVISLEDDFGKY
jgi:methyl-accepting chemotaxis protein